MVREGFEKNQFGNSNDLVGATSRPPFLKMCLFTLNFSIFAINMLPTFSRKVIDCQEHPSWSRKKIPSRRSNPAGASTTR